MKIPILLSNLKRMNVRTINSTLKHEKKKEFVTET